MWPPAIRFHFVVIKREAGTTRLVLSLETSRETRQPGLINTAGSARVLCIVQYYGYTVYNTACIIVQYIVHIICTGLIIYIFIQRYIVSVKRVDLSFKSDLGGVSQYWLM